MCRRKFVYSILRCHTFPYIHTQTQTHTRAHPAIAFSIHPVYAWIYYILYINSWQLMEPLTRINCDGFVRASKQAIERMCALYTSFRTHTRSLCFSLGVHWDVPLSLSFFCPFPLFNAYRRKNFCKWFSMVFVYFSRNTQKVVSDSNITSTEYTRTKERTADYCSNSEWESERERANERVKMAKQRARSHLCKI